MFEVRIGPVAGKTAREFLPLDVHATAKHRLQLESLISFCQPANSDWRVAVTVRSDEAQMELGAKTPTAVLGLTSQLGRQHSDVDVEAMFAA